MKSLQRTIAHTLRTPSVARWTLCSSVASSRWHVWSYRRPKNSNRSHAPGDTSVVVRIELAPRLRDGGVEWIGGRVAAYQIRCGSGSDASDCCHPRQGQGRPVCHQLTLRSLPLAPGKIPTGFNAAVPRAHGRVLIPETAAQSQGSHGNVNNVELRFAHLTRTASYLPISAPLLIS